MRIGLLRGGVVAGALVYAALAIGNGLDRVAPERPAEADHVPAMFATDALAVTGEADLRRDPGAAAVVAQRLVVRAPIEPFSTALLGASRAAIGDDAGADRAFRVAGQLGWRIPLTQSYWLSAALAAGDFRVAAQRLDALLRQRPQSLSDPALVAPFEDNAAGRNALLDRLVLQPPWLSWYAGAMDPVPDPATVARRAPILMMLADHGIVLGCAVVAPAVSQLVAAGLAGEAEALRRRGCPAAPS